MMSTLILVAHSLVCVTIIGLVLIQQGKGSASGLMGGGASSTMFGSVGSAPFLVKLTTILALLFFCSSFTLSYLVKVEAPSSVVLAVKKGS